MEKRAVINNFCSLDIHGGALKMIYHPEGVIHPSPETAENETAFVYDYFIKDYTSTRLSEDLGNVRVVTEEINASMSSLTMAFISWGKEICPTRFSQHLLE